MGKPGFFHPLGKAVKKLHYLRIIPDFRKIEHAGIYPELHGKIVERVIACLHHSLKFTAVSLL